jgi:hypothetical protein
MRIILFAGTCLVAALLAACSADQDPEGTPVEMAGYTDIMSAMVAPAADRIWNAAGTTSDATGTRSNAPQTVAEWAEVRRSAVILGESMHLVATARRPVVTGMSSDRATPDGGGLSPAEIQALIDGDRGEFTRLAKAMQDTAIRVIEAADSRDAGSFEALGTELDSACEGCHIKFWYPPLQSNS